MNVFEFVFSVAGSLLLLSSIIPLVWFMYLYGTRSPWRLTVIGRSLMYQKGIIALILVLAAVSVFIPDFGFRSFLRFLVYGAVVWTFWNDVVNLTRIQNQHRPKKLRKSRTKSL